MKKPKCLCKTSNVVKDKDGTPVAVSVQPNYSCPVCFPEENCPEHKWKAGGVNKKCVVIFCENCGKVKSKKLTP